MKYQSHKLDANTSALNAFEIANDESDKFNELEAEEALQRLVDVAMVNPTDDVTVEALICSNERFRIKNADGVSDWIQDAFHDVFSIKPLEKPTQELNVFEVMTQVSKLHRLLRVVELQVKDKYREQQ